MDAASGSRDERFRALYGGSFDALLAYALRRCAEPQDAADVVSETFLVAWRRLDEVPPGAEARLWLYGVARRVLANQRRGASRRERLGSRLRSDLPAVVPDHAETLAAHAVVREALARLGERDREVLSLSLWEGLEPREIARVLGLPAGTVRMRLSRARGRVRGDVGDDLPPAGHDPGDHAATAEERGDLR